MEHSDILRRLAIHDPGVLSVALERDPAETPLSQRDAALVRFAATVATGASSASFSAAVDEAISAQLTVPELADALLAITPTVGLPRAVSAAQHLLVALDPDDDLGAPVDA